MNLLPEIDYKNCYKNFNCFKMKKILQFNATTDKQLMGEYSWKRKRVLIVLILSALKTKKLSAYHRLAS